MKNFLKKYKKFLLVATLLPLDVAVFLENPPFNCTAQGDLGECHFDMVVIYGLIFFSILCFGLIVYSYKKTNDQDNSERQNMFIGAVAILVLIGVFLFIRTPNRIYTGSFLMHPVYPTNYADDAILLGASHNVFIVKIIAQVGNKDVVGNPATQFSVEVIKNIKGDLKDEVIVNQEGGYKNGVLYLMEESGALLQVGNTYLLSVRYNAKENWYTLNPHPNASKLLSTDSSKSPFELANLADQDEKVKALEVAYPEEKLLDSDIAHNNTLNEFKSLDAKSKANAQSRADVAKASLAAKAE